MFAVNSSGNFKSESFSSPRKSNSDDDFSIRMSDKTSSYDKGFKNEKINSNMKPLFSNTSSGNIRIPENKRVNIKPKFVSSNSSVKSFDSNNSSSNVPIDSFSAFSNPKTSINGSQSSNSDAEDDDDDDSDNYASEEDDEEEANTPRSRSGSYVSGSGSGSYNSGSESGSSEYGSDEESDDEDDDEEDDDESSTSSNDVKKMSYEDIQREKQNLLFELERLQKAGFTPSKRYSMASTYEEMKFERDRLKRMRDVERSIKFSRKMLIGFAGGVEYLNKTFNPADLKLNGWSENIMENVNDYDEVFEELHDKYSDSVKMPPELKLVMMVAGSGFMFHMTNSFLKSATPDLRDVLRNNPDIMANINAAASKDMGSKIDQTYGRNNPISSVMKGGLDMKQKQMSGPANIDDLLGGDDSSVGNIKSFGSRNGSRKSGISLNI
jgi:hypothetical protein